MEYADKFTAISTRNAGFHGKCQRCGKDSVTSGVCPSCSNIANESMVRPLPSVHPMFSTMIKEVTVRGCDVLVNGKVYCTRKSNQEAQIMALATQRRFTSHNLAVRGLMKSIRG